MTMRKFWATYRRHDSTKPFSLSITAEDVPQAIDKMYSYCGVERTHPDDEYDLMEIVGLDQNQYVPVAQKYKSGIRKRLSSQIEEAEEKTFTEKEYVSYRDVA